MKRFQSLITHEAGRAQHFFVKVVYRNWLVYSMWPVVSWCLNQISRVKGVTGPNDVRPTSAALLVGRIDSFESGRVPGQNLTALTKCWLTETIGFGQVTECDFSTISAVAAPTMIVITPDWILDHIDKPIRHGLRLIRISRKMNVPVAVMLPDGFLIWQTAFTSFIVAFSGGCQVLLQDTAEDHTRFGTVNPSAPHFWTWPPSHVDKWHNNKDWAGRKNQVLAARTGGGDLRATVVRNVADALEKEGYTIIPTNWELSWEDYVQLNLDSKIVVTTCSMHPDYFRGPRFYKVRIPKYTITGRVWEAFASNNVLFTNENPALEGLGFFPMVHYVPVQICLNGQLLPVEIPGPDGLEGIAAAGSQRFRDLVTAGVRGNVS